MSWRVLSDLEKNRESSIRHDLTLISPARNPYSHLPSLIQGPGIRVSRAVVLTPLVFLSLDKLHPRQRAGKGLGLTPRASPRPASAAVGSMEG